MDRTVLVTGSTGFVGAHVLERARARDLEAVAASGDLRDPEVARGLVEEARPFAVLHLASARARRGADVWGALGDDLLMAGSILKAVRARPGTVVLFPGSAAQYGLGGSERLPETAPTAPVGGYGAAKSVLEAACLAPALRGPVRIIWTRSYNHVGPGQGLDAPVPSWARQVAEAEHAELATLRTGNLESIRDFLDVRDVADAYLELVASDAEGVVNVCSGRGVRLREIAESMAELSEVPLTIEPDPELERAIDPLHVVGDPTLLQELTGWAPSFGLERTLQDVLDEWRERVAQEQRQLVAREA
jgi:GDP-4-dehydro-6-deoxy-D-mannose reductase